MPVLIAVEGGLGSPGPLVTPAKFEESRTRDWSIES